MSNSAATNTSEDALNELAPKDIQSALEELEQSLQYSVDQLGPSLDAIGEQLQKAANDIRKNSDASKLWSCLNNLQQFLKLVETIATTAGIPWEDMATFDEALSGGLEELEEKMENAQTTEDMACAIETSLLPTLAYWNDCEPAFRRVIEGDSSGK